MTLVCGKEVEMPDMKNNLAVIEYVRDRLLEQNKCAGHTGSGCFFRYNHDGSYSSVSGSLACALGWLIPDEEYKKGGSSYLYKIDIMTNPLSSELRNIHNDHVPEEWPELFADLKSKYEQAQKERAYYIWLETGEDQETCWTKAALSQ